MFSRALLDAQAAASASATTTTAAAATTTATAATGSPERLLRSSRVRQRHLDGVTRRRRHLRALAGESAILVLPEVVVAKVFTRTWSLRKVTLPKEKVLFYVHRVLKKLSEYKEVRTKANVDAKSSPYVKLKPFLLRVKKQTSHLSFLSSASYCIAMNDPIIVTVPLLLRAPETKPFSGSFQLPFDMPKLRRKTQQIGGPSRPQSVPSRNQVS